MKWSFPKLTRVSFSEWCLSLYGLRPRPCLLYSSLTVDEKNALDFVSGRLDNLVYINVLHPINSVMISIQALGIRAYYAQPMYYSATCNRKIAVYVPLSK